MGSSERIGTGQPETDRLQSVLQSIKDNIKRVIIGKDQVIDLLLAAILAEGHILLEDVPGTGKTMLAKSLAKSMDLVFSRIQFTPDLLPSDVTGLNYYNQKEGEFRFRQGPVFANIVLADEINRATPRTQSSLLECMEERQVTLDGETRRLDAPFLVIATQNPIETYGTYPLPEAQLDRFLMQLSMGTPDEREELAILNRFLEQNPYEELEAVCTKEQIRMLQTACQQIYIHPVMLSYIAQLSCATRKDSQVLTGVSPRGTLGLMRASRALALVRGRSFVTPEDIKETAVPVLAHRLVLPRTITGGRSKPQLMEQILGTVPVPTEEWERP